MAFITCPVCNYEMSDQCTKCPHCGENISTIPPPKAIHEPSYSSSSPNNLWCNIGIVVSILAIICGLIIIFSAKPTLGYASFGGDFYTYTYKGIRAIEASIVTFTKSLGALICVLGMISICKFAFWKK